MSAPRRRLLMVAFHYPPEGGSSGVLRTLKFSRYLLRHGWEPHVLTLAASAYPVRDDSLRSQIPPEVVVHRTRSIDTGRHLAIRGRYLSCLAVPDRFIGWLPFAVRRGRSVIRRHGIDAIYSTSPLATAHLVALALRRATRRPWIADFRDPWIEEGIHPRPGTLRDAVERRLERAVVEGADRLVMTTPPLRDEILSRHPRVPREKARVIYNGYDETDFEELRPAPKGGPFELMHAGLVTPDFRDPAPVFRAVAELLDAGGLDRANVRVTFLGGGGYVDSDAFRASVATYGLSDVVRVEPRVSHRESLQRLANASALLLLQASDDTRSLIPAKAFEYLRLSRPILALTLEGATADLLRGLEACHVLAPGDSDELRRVIRSLVDAWDAGGERAETARPIARYERSMLAGELAETLDQVCGTSERTGAGR